MPDTDRDRLVARLQELAAQLSAAHRLTAEQGECLALVHLAAALVRHGTSPGQLPFLDQVAVALSDPDVVEAATGPLGPPGLPARDGGEQAWSTLLTALADRAPGTAGVHVALAHSLEATGELAAMEHALRCALRLDPDHRLAHGDLGELAALRGEFRAASRHLDRAGRPPMGLAAVAANLGWGPIQAERNAPCPCGSGIRFKRCCLQTGGWPLDARIQLLPTRLADWLERPVWLRRRLAFAGAVLGVDSLGAAADRALEAAFAPGMLELHLFEGCGIGQVVDELGPVLRADERHVLTGWVGCRHDLYRVLGPGPGETRLLAVRTGEVREVAGFDDDLVEGDRALMLAVVVAGAPSRGRGWVLGGEPIPLDDDAADEIRTILDTHRDPVALARAAITPVLELQRALATIDRRHDRARDDRLRWLFGDHVDVDSIRDLDDVDDLATTTYLRGGGFTAAADYIRWAARQVAEGEPPEVWARAQQLTSTGHDRETVLLHLACAWGVATQHGPDPDAVHAAHLAHLRSRPTRRRGSA